MQTIETKVIELGKPPEVDPFSVYRRTILRYGDRHAFLAESISGPMEDCRHSIVAIGHLASVSFTHDTICIEANNIIKENLIKTIESSQSEIQFSASGTAKILAKKEIFFST